MFIQCNSIAFAKQLSAAPRLIHRQEGVVKEMRFLVRSSMNTRYLLVPIKSGSIKTNCRCSHIEVSDFRSDSLVYSLCAHEALKFGGYAWGKLKVFRVSPVACARLVATNG